MKLISNVCKNLWTFLLARRMQVKRIGGWLLAIQALQLVIGRVNCSYIYAMVHFIRLGEEWVLLGETEFVLLWEVVISPMVVTGTPSTFENLIGSTQRVIFNVLQQKQPHGWINPKSMIWRTIAMLNYLNSTIGLVLVVREVTVREGGLVSNEELSWAIQ